MIKYSCLYPAVCVFGCHGSDCHKSKTAKVLYARRNQQPICWLNCFVCKRKIYSTCDPKLREFVVQHNVSIGSAPKRILTRPTQRGMRRRFRCNDCRLRSKIVRFDGRNNSFAVSCTVIIFTAFLIFTRVKLYTK